MMMRRPYIKATEGEYLDTRISASPNHVSLSFVSLLNVFPWPRDFIIIVIKIP